MERLSATDVDVLEAGSGPALGHVAQLLLLESEGDHLDLASVRSWYATRLHRAPAFRRRLVRVPFGLHRPLWVDDPDFDLARHVRGLTVPTVDQAGLEASVGRLLGLPIDLDHPPWEVWVLDGFSGGGVAVLTKQHLAAVDDRVGDAIAVAAFDLQADARPDPVEDWSPEPQPSDADLVGRGVASRLRRPRLLADAAVDLARRREARPPRPVPSVFPGALTSARSVALTALPLDAVRAIKDHHDVTVNDVVLAVCAGALRSCLGEAGTLPVDPLLALVPVSVAGDPDDGASDHVSSVISSLATDTRDPVLRIQVIHDATREARRRKAIRARRLRDWTEFAAPAVLGQAGRVAVQAVRDAAGPPANLIVANVPGPTAQLFCAGAPVRDLFFFGPLAPDVPLGISVVSAGDRMEVAIVACPAVGPDVGDLARHVDGALDELRATLPAPVEGSGPEPPGGGGADGPDPAPSAVVEDVRATLARSRRTREQAGRLTDLLGGSEDAPRSGD